MWLSCWLMINFYESIANCTLHNIKVGAHQVSMIKKFLEEKLLIIQMKKY